LQVRRTLVDQETQSIGRLAVGYPLPIVDHQRDGGGVVVEVVDQRGQRLAHRLLPAPFEEPHGRGRYVGTDATDRLEHMPGEPHHVVVVVIDGQPGRRHPGAIQFRPPLLRQRGLAESRGRANQDQPSTPGRA
jgi:hypothetical protein